MQTCRAYLRCMFIRVPLQWPDEGWKNFVGLLDVQKLSVQPEVKAL